MSKRPVFTCVTYRCSLTAGACSARWRKANAPRDEHGSAPRALGDWVARHDVHCRGCPVGELHAQQPPVPDEPPVLPPSPPRRGRPPPQASPSAEAYRLSARARPGELERIAFFVDRRVVAEFADRSERRRGSARRQARAAVLRRCGAKSVPEVAIALGVPDVPPMLVSVWIDRGRRLVARVLRALDDDPSIAAVRELMGAETAPGRVST